MKCYLCLVLSLLFLLVSAFSFIFVDIVNFYSVVILFIFL